MSSLRRRIPSESDSQPRPTIVEVNGNYSGPVTGPTRQTTYTVPSVGGLSDLTDMTCRDRTLEFISAIKSLQGRQGNGFIPPRPNKKPDVNSWKEFMQVAKLIGKDLAQTYAKLEKLTVLAKKKSLFDDKPMEIQELTYIIKQDINSLNKQIAQLQQAVRSRQVQKGKHMQSHTNTVVVSLQSKLASMSHEFRHVLEVRTENLKHQRSRQEQFGESSGVPSGLPAAAMAGPTRGAVLLANPQQQYQYGAEGGDTAIAIDSHNQHQYQQQQLVLIDEQDSYLQSRAETMQNIESTIVELGGIFQQLAHMVKEQEEVIQRIDHNVDDTHLNVEAAHTEILKYFQSVTSNRWLIIKVFAVLIIFFIIFVVFMA